MTSLAKKFGARLGSVALLVLLAGGASSCPELFQLERQRVAAGEWWRLWTAHLVHGSGEHFLYDVLAAVLLGLCFGGLWRLVLWAPFLSVLLYVYLPQLQVYYGLSGLLHGWIVCEAGGIARSDRGPRAWIAGVLVSGTIAKALMETLSGSSWFTSDLDFGGPVVHASHLLGCGLGLLALLLRSRRNRVLTVQFAND